MRKIVLLITILALVFSVNAQQMGTFTQTIENKYLINPAVAGSTDDMPVFLGYKQMWTGIDQAPSSQLLNFNMKFSDKLGGVGGKLFNYSTGHISKSGINLTYAYHLELNDDMKLSFGLSGALYQVNLNRSELKIEDQNDMLILNGSEKLIVPDANFGIYLYAKNYYVGISSYQLFGRKVNLMNDAMNLNQERHYFFTAGYVLEASSDFDVELSMMTKYAETGFAQWDVYVKGTYKKMVWLAAGYRSDFDFDPNDAVISIGIQQDKIKLGYAYDYNLTDIANVSSGTHEIILMYMLGRTKDGAYKW